MNSFMFIIISIVLIVLIILSVCTYFSSYIATKSKIPKSETIIYILAGAFFSCLLVSTLFYKEISTDEFMEILQNKEECSKYFTCIKKYDEIMVDSKVTNYEYYIFTDVFQKAKYEEVLRKAKIEIEEIKKEIVLNKRSK